MWWRLVLIILLADDAQAYTRVPIKWVGPHLEDKFSTGSKPNKGAKRFVIAPRISSIAPIPPLKLTIEDVAYAMSRTGIPLFTSRSDNTIVHDATGWCIEAYGARSGDKVSVNHCTGGPTQRWNQLQLDGGGKTLIQLKGTNKCLNVADTEGDLNGAALELHDCKNTMESWDFEEFGHQGTPQTAAPSSGMRHVFLLFLCVTVLSAMSLGAWLWRHQKSSESVVVSDALETNGGVSLTSSFASQRDVGQEDEDAHGANKAGLRATQVEQSSEHQLPLTEIAYFEAKKADHGTPAAFLNTWLADMEFQRNHQDSSMEAIITDKAEGEELEPKLLRIVETIVASSALIPAVMVVNATTIEDSFQDTADEGGSTEQQELSSLVPAVMTFNVTPESTMELGIWGAVEGRTTNSQDRKEARGTDQSGFIADVNRSVTHLVENGKKSYLKFVRRPPLKQDDTTIKYSISRMTGRMQTLEDGAANPRLSKMELGMLLGAVGTAFLSPFLLGAEIVNGLVPTMSALVAALGVMAERGGTQAKARGAEVAAVALNSAFEAEMYLARAERAMAILPVCVGVSVTTCSLSKFAPYKIVEMVGNFRSTADIDDQVFLICPLLASIAAALAALASAESAAFAGIATGVGDRKFSGRKRISRTWLSATEQIEVSSDQIQQKWVDFAGGVLFAPVIAGFVPGDLETKAIAAAGVAFAQCSYTAASAEQTLAAAAEAVALKSRSSAVADTYSKQGTKAYSPLPYCSALSGLCAAGSVPLMEVLPLVKSAAGQSVICAAFPTLAALFVGTAFITQQRILLNAEAAAEAATSLGESGYNNKRQTALSVTSGLIRRTLETGRLQWQRSTKRISSKSYGRVPAVMKVSLKDKLRGRTRMTKTSRRKRLIRLLNKILNLFRFRRVPALESGAQLTDAVDAQKGSVLN